MTEPQQPPAVEPEAVKQLWTVREVAAFLRCSDTYVYELVAAKCIPHGKIGKLVRFSPEDVQNWWRIRKSRGR